MSNASTPQLDKRILVFKPDTVQKTPATVSTTTVAPAVITIFIEENSTLESMNGSIIPRILVPEVPDTKTVNTAAPVNGTLELCAPFPTCNPIGCGDPTIAPVDCKQCDNAGTGAVIFGMILLSLFIIVANFLVIRVILRHASLRRRHGYIKLSMATSDLLVGLLVIPSAIANLIGTLYYPMQSVENKAEHGEYSSQEKLEHVKQTNSIPSVMFGTIAVIAVTSSLYNLLLLSADRFLAIARPLKHHAGRNFPKRTLWISLAAVWIFGIVLSSVPAFFPDSVVYEMDLTTFFYVQRILSAGNGAFPPAYITIIIGGPYFLTVLLIILTAIYTWKSLQVRNRLSSRGKLSKSAVQRKQERNNRMKMIQEAYPEAILEDEPGIESMRRMYRGEESHHKKKKGSSNEEKHSWLSWWKNEDCVFGRSSNSNNNSNGSEDSMNSQSPRYQKTRDQMSIVREVLNPAKKKVKSFNRKTHIRVFKMLLAMVAGFTICLLPYVIVVLKISEGTLHCNNLSGPFTFALYMLFINSGMNFVIYNLWHPEFRANLKKMLENDFSKTKGIKMSAGPMFRGTQWGTESSQTYVTRANTAATTSND